MDDIRGCIVLDQRTGKFVHSEAWCQGSHQRTTMQVDQLIARLRPIHAEACPESRVARTCTAPGRQNGGEAVSSAGSPLLNRPAEEYEFSTLKLMRAPL